MLDLPSPVIEALAEILEAAADGKEVPVLRSPEDLTTEQAGRCPWRLPAHCCPAESGKIPAWSALIARLSLSEFSPTGRRRSGGPTLSMS